MDEEGRELEDEECETDKKVITKPCNTHQCPKWQTGHWLPVCLGFVSLLCFVLCLITVCDRPATGSLYALALFLCCVLFFV